MASARAHVTGSDEELRGGREYACSLYDVRGEATRFRPVSPSDLGIFIFLCDGNDVELLSLTALESSTPTLTVHRRASQHRSLSFGFVLDLGRGAGVSPALATLQRCDSGAWRRLLGEGWREDHPYPLAFGAENVSLYLGPRPLVQTLQSTIPDAHACAPVPAPPSPSRFRCCLNAGADGGQVKMKTPLRSDPRCAVPVLALPPRTPLLHSLEFGTHTRRFLLPRFRLRARTRRHAALCDHQPRPPAPSFRGVHSLRPWIGGDGEEDAVWGSLSASLAAFAFLRFERGERFFHSSVLTHAYITGGGDTGTWRGVPAHAPRRMDGWIDVEGCGTYRCLAGTGLLLASQSMVAGPAHLPARSGSASSWRFRVRRGPGADADGGGWMDGRMDRWTMSVDWKPQPVTVLAASVAPIVLPAACVLNFGQDYDTSSLVPIAFIPPSSSSCSFLPLRARAATGLRLDRVPYPPLVSYRTQGGRKTGGVLFSLISIRAGHVWLHPICSMLPTWRAPRLETAGADRWWVRGARHIWIDVGWPPRLRPRTMGYSTAASWILASQFSEEGSGACASSGPVACTYVCGC
ncbi:hypothetical protein B0H14DRAFT_3570943 [Mycena olivaceomarginata]|nr:hypothetical protein B0H14DRAFT_3570943 [Mycena olivaceomarginata]